jgi:hypothetical protein
MLVRSKQNESSARWRRRARVGHAAEARLSSSTQSDATVGASAERRHGGPSEDRALYTCECGYAFEALVTTSVGCPHCTRTQAW